MSRFERIGSHERRERPDFLDAYNAVAVPETIISMDASDARLAEMQNNFFKDIYESLDLSPRTYEYFFEIDVRRLLTEQHVAEQYYGTDDFQHRLRKRGQQILASVTYERDDWNFQVAHFAKYPLVENTIRSIRELHHLERIEFGLE